MLLSYYIYRLVSSLARLRVRAVHAAVEAIAIAGDGLYRRCSERRKS